MHPVLFSIPTPWGAVPIYSYGVMLGTSILFAWYFIMYMGVKKENFSRDLMGSAFTWTVVGALVGARLLYVFTNLGEFDTLSSWFDVRSGGLVAYGGFLGGFVTAWVFFRRQGMSLLPWADVAVPTLGTGLMFTRIGCYLYGCDYGKPLGENAPAFLQNAGTFPKWNLEDFPTLACNQTLNGSPAYQHHLHEYAAQMTDRTASLPVHPTQLYESGVGIVLFLIALFVLSRRTFRGQVLIVMAGLYGLWRFIIEYLRDDPERGFAFGFSTSQLISLAVLPACAFAYVALKKRAKEKGDIEVPKHAQEPSG